MAKVTEVFTPTTPAREAFVDRKQADADLVEALGTPGKQVVVYGHSGSGKTTLVLNRLWQLYEDHVTTQCLPEMTFDNAVSDAFGQLDAFYKAERRHRKDKTRGWSVSGESVIKGGISGGSSEADESTERRLGSPAETPQALARSLGRANVCWVLEDFHKMASSEKTRLAQSMKVFCNMADEFPKLRIVAIGAVDSARQVVKYEREMMNRISEIHVPLMSDEEIALIIAKGQEALNIVIPRDVIASIVEYAEGLGSVCHQLCLNMCVAAGIVEKGVHAVRLRKSDLEVAVERYLAMASDTLKATFEAALQLDKGAQSNVTELILKALVDASREGATTGELQGLISTVEPDLEMNLDSILQAMQGEEGGFLLRHDGASGRYAFADPIYRAYARVRFGKPASRQAVAALLAKMMVAMKKLQ
jgi:energy-coupling factor transporter ATP-binding protein EcfA2